MGQFKPMVKMMTTEPSVILKLKKGGKVEHKMDGGYMPMQSTMPAQAMPAGLPARGGSAPAASPMKPSMAARRKAMMAKPTKPMNASLLMKKGGKAEMHEDAAQDRAMIKKAMAGKKFATGGVVNGQAGYKDGGKVYSKGIIPESVSAKGAEGFKNTKMHTAKPDRSPAKTGDVKLGNGGGYKTGGVAKANGGGYKTGGVAKANGGGYCGGGSTKKFAEGGAVQDDGKAVKMKQGSKPTPPPVSITALSGTYKKGGKVTKAEGRLQKAFKSENATAMKEAKMDSVLKYPKSATIKKADGGSIDAKAISDKASRELEEALNPISMAKELYGKAKNFVTEKVMPKGSVTETQKSVTVSPSKKRGGSVKC